MCCTDLPTANITITLCARHKLFANETTYWKCKNNVYRSKEKQKCIYFFVKCISGAYRCGSLAFFPYQFQTYCSFLFEFGIISQAVFSQSKICNLIESACFSLPYTKPLNWVFQIWYTLCIIVCGNYSEKDTHMGQREGNREREERANEWENRVSDGVINVALE